MKVIANHSVLITNSCCKLPLECQNERPNLRTTIEFTNNCIEKIIKNVDSNKIHGHDIIMHILRMTCLDLVLRMMSYHLNGKKEVNEH